MSCRLLCLQFLQSVSLFIRCHLLSVALESSKARRLLSQCGGPDQLPDTILTLEIQVTHLSDLSEDSSRLSSH